MSLPPRSAGKPRLISKSITALRDERKELFLDWSIDWSISFVRYWGNLLRPLNLVACPVSRHISEPVILSDTPRPRRIYGARQSQVVLHAHGLRRLLCGGRAGTALRRETRDLNLEDLDDQEREQIAFTARSRNRSVGAQIL